MVLRRAVRVAAASVSYLVGYLIASLAAFVGFGVGFAVPSVFAHLAQLGDGLVWGYLVVFVLPYVAVAVVPQLLLYEVVSTRLKTGWLAWLGLGLMGTIFIDLSVARLLYVGLPFSKHLDEAAMPPYSSHLLPLVGPALVGGFAAALVWLGTRRLVRAILSSGPISGRKGGASITTD